MNRLLIILCAALLLGGCVSQKGAYKWLDKNPRKAAEWAAVKYPPKTVKGETKVVKVVDSVEKVVRVVDSIPCPDGSIVVTEKDIQYVVKKEYLERVDTVENTAAVERERLRANEAEREVAVKDGQLTVAQEKAKSRLWWIGGLGLTCVLLFAFIIRRIF